MLPYGIMSPKGDNVANASRIRPARDAAARAQANDETIAFDSR